MPLAQANFHVSLSFPQLVTTSNMLLLTQPHSTHTVRPAKMCLGTSACCCLHNSTAPTLPAPAHEAHTLKHAGHQRERQHQQRLRGLDHRQFHAAGRDAGNQYQVP